MTIKALGDHIDFTADTIERMQQHVQEAAKKYGFVPAGTPRDMILGQANFILRRSNERWAFRLGSVRVADPAGSDDWWAERGGFCDPTRRVYR